LLRTGLTTLIKLKTQSPGLITNEAAAHIRATIVRISKHAAVCRLLWTMLQKSDESWKSNF